MSLFDRIFSNAEKRRQERNLAKLNAELENLDNKEKVINQEAIVQKKKNRIALLELERDLEKKINDISNLRNIPKGKTLDQLKNEKTELEAKLATVKLKIYELNKPKVVEYAKPIGSNKPNQQINKPVVTKPVENKPVQTKQPEKSEPTKVEST